MKIRSALRPHLLSSSWLWISLLVGTAVLGFSNAEATFLGCLIAFYLVPAWLLILLIRFTVWSLRRKSGKGRVLEKPWLSWLLEPMLVLVLVGLIWCGGLRWLRFAVSYPWLYLKAKGEVEHMKTAGPQKWRQWEDGFQICGLYRVIQWESGTATDGSPQFLILTAYMTLTDAAGWAYVPSGAKPNGIKTGQPCYFDHMIGPWWLWRLDQ